MWCSCGRKKLARAAAQEKYGAINGGSHILTRVDSREVVDVEGKEKERENAPAVWIRECLPEDVVSIRDDAPVSTRQFFSIDNLYSFVTFGGAPRSRRALLPPAGSD